MRIIVEVRKEYFEIYGDVAVRTEVLWNKERKYSLEKRFMEDELNSHFDIIWESIGRELKDQLSTKQREATK